MKKIKFPKLPKFQKLFNLKKPKIKNISHSFVFLKNIKSFFQKVSKFFSRFFSHRFIIRTIIFSFFLGLNIALGNYFIKTNSFHFPNQITDILSNYGIVEKEKFNYLKAELSKDYNRSLDPQIILEKLNEERKIYEVGELEYNDSLATAAAILLSQAEKYEFDLSDKDFSLDLKGALDEVGYDYSYVNHNILVGPTLEQAVVNSWFSDENQAAAIKNDEFIEVGFATKIIELKYMGTVGVVVQVLGSPQKTVAVAPQKNTSNEIKFPVISDQEVIDALNNYRLVHNVRTLNVDENLCRYAEKRVRDLVLFGGLDGHSGFTKDFEDQGNLPGPIKSYNGNQVAENLAHQYCRNMTTGDSFVAETGTAIIEWCFDSSTKGHREAQLNPEYENVCVRHGNNMYVVIFGN
ncbi:hypothetical protein KA111_00305 [Candidatus Woesebacteria bacterium]|nr:hypothetical protein [Candidatus Woesebacteria bacterium]